MAQFDFYLNRQGVRGPQGIQGEQGFSPIITVATNTLSEYVLQIQTQNNTFLTANLREHKDDLGGTYIRYNRETGVMFAGDADVASQSQMGVVRFATAADIEREDDSSVVSPADVADMIEAIDPSSDISDLQDRVTTLEGKTESLEGNVSDNSLAISELQSSVSGLLANYVPKTRTINGYALSSNITLAASDVNAYSKSEADALLAAKADVSDLPDMNNYYNTTQIDLMLNDKADISDIPTVGNGTITFTQGGVTKGAITTNQSGDTTIALDAGGGGGTTYTEGTGIDITNDVISVDFTNVATASQGTKADTAVQPSDLATVATTGDYTDLLNTPSPYTLPAATTSTLGGVIVDGTTITVDSNGVITSVGGGGGGTTYNPGNGIDINSSTNTISAKPDGTTIDFNTNGELKVISAPTPSNMVTTNTNQTITGVKTFGNLTLYSDAISHGTGGIVYEFMSNYNQFGSITKNTMLRGAEINITRKIGGNQYQYVNVDSGNISTYALTSLPTASTSTLGGVKVDGTTITIDNNGVISSSGGGGSSGATYESGKGISIGAKVIYAYDASGLGIIGFTKEYDTDDYDIEVSEIIPVVYKLDNGQFIQYATNCLVEHGNFGFDWEITIGNVAYHFERASEYDYTPANTYIISNTGLINNTASGTTKAITDKAIDSGVSSAVVIGGGDVGIGSSSVAIGYDTFDGYGQAVCVGYNAQNACTGGIAIGYKSNVTYNCQSNGIAIGNRAKVNANGAIQLSNGTNATANTLQVGSYTLLNTSTGKIPSDRLQIASTSTLGGVKVDGTTITIDNDGVISSAGGSGSSYTAGPGIDITNNVISIDDTLVATQTDLDEKQDSFESVAPLNLTQAVSVGKAYLANTTTEFTGSTFSQQLSLLKSGNTSVGNIAELDDPTSAVFEFKNIKINSLSANTILEIKPARARSGIIRISSNGSQLRAYQNLNNSSTQNLAGGVGDYLDFRIRYDKNSQSTYIDYKLSSASSYTTALSISYAAWGTGSGVQYITVGSSNTTIDITNIVLTASGTNIFERKNSQLSLSIGTGLAVQNGSLVNTNPTPVDVSTKVTGDGISTIKALTQAEYDALTASLYAWNYNSDEAFYYTSSSSASVGDNVYSSNGTVIGSVGLIVDSDTIIVSVSGLTYRCDRDATNDITLSPDANTVYVIKSGSSS